MWDIIDKLWPNGCPILAGHDRPWPTMAIHCQPLPAIASYCRLLPAVASYGRFQSLKSLAGQDIGFCSGHWPGHDIAPQTPWGRGHREHRAFSCLAVTVACLSRRSLWRSRISPIRLSKWSCVLGSAAQGVHSVSILTRRARCQARRGARIAASVAVNPWPGRWVGKAHFPYDGPKPAPPIRAKN